MPHDTTRYISISQLMFPELYPLPAAAILMPRATPPSRAFPCLCAASARRPERQVDPHPRNRRSPVPTHSSTHTARSSTRPRSAGVSRRTGRRPRRCSRGGPSSAPAAHDCGAIGARRTSSSTGHECEPISSRPVATRSRSPDPVAGREQGRRRTVAGRGAAPARRPARSNAGLLLLGGLPPARRVRWPGTWVTWAWGAPRPGPAPAACPRPVHMGSPRRDPGRHGGEVGPGRGARPGRAAVRVDETRRRSPSPPPPSPGVPNPRLRP